MNKRTESAPTPQQAEAMVRNGMVWDVDSARTWLVQAARKVRTTRELDEYEANAANTVAWVRQRLGVELEVPYLDRRTIERAEAAATEAAAMTKGQRGLWELLDGCAMKGPELARALDTSEDTVRQWVCELRRAGRVVAHRRGRGYWRPDAPPPT